MLKLALAYQPARAAAGATKGAQVKILPRLRPDNTRSSSKTWTTDVAADFELVVVPRPIWTSPPVAGGVQSL